jgi:hypothetical protein
MGWKPMLRGFEVAPRLGLLLSDSRQAVEQVLADHDVLTHVVSQLLALTDQALQLGIVLG